MARGGFRAGAGRPVGSLAAVTKRPRASERKKRVPKEKKLVVTSLPEKEKTGYVAAAAADPTLTPLAFLLSAVRDETLTLAERTRAAAIAAPFCHARAGEKGKKDEKADAAASAASGKFATPAAPRLIHGGKN